MGIRPATLIRKLEDYTVNFLFVISAILLLADAGARIIFHTGVRNASAYVQQATLAAAFLSGAIASREKKHLSMAAGLRLTSRAGQHIKKALDFIAGAITFALTFSSLAFAYTAFSARERVGFLPKRLFALVIFLGFAVMAWRFLAGIKGKKMRALLGALSIFLGAFLSFSSIANLVGVFSPGLAARLQPAAAFVQSAVASAATPVVILIIVSAFLGLPIFVVLGGVAFFLFAKAGEPLEVMANQAYSVLTGYSIPAIPLFALIGFFLSESRAGERLVVFFRTILGWFPGGLTVVAVLVCAFFTTFTGGSGITILALGGLLYQILKEEGYQDSFSVGLLTSSGSIGLLWPPSLPIIIYGVIAGVSIKDMFVGGLVPGAVRILAVILLCLVFSRRAGLKRHPFQPKETLPALKECFWELLLPALIIGLYFGGVLNLQESAAFGLLYVILVEVLIKKEISWKGMPRVFSAGAMVFGGVLIILAMANGLSYYIIDTQLPQRLSAWVAATISSRFVFLVLLNATLLVVGCFMDIYSAILVVVPLIIPLGALFHVHPVHLGIIFLANMEVGYLTPPVGLNLFLASYRFERPLSKIYRDVLAFLAIMLVTVLLITYLPFLTTILLPKS